MEKELSDAATKDLGKCHFVNFMYEFSNLHREIDGTLADLGNWMKDESVDCNVAIGPAKCYKSYEPLGVICVMGSWNYPLSTALAPCIAAIAAGNAVVLKPSEMAPFSAKAMKTLFARYLDLSVYKCVNGMV